MSQIKIFSNPYKKELSFEVYDNKEKRWINIKDSNPESKLRDFSIQKVLLDFQIIEIIQTIIKEYFVNEHVTIIFEGTNGEYENIETVIKNSEDLLQKVILKKGDNYLRDAEEIFPDIINNFNNIKEYIDNIDMTEKTRNDYDKLKDDLDLKKPICVFGNYSCGKSTFINALIGRELLPTGSDPLTALLYEITNSKDENKASVHFPLFNNEITIEISKNKYSIDNNNEGNILASKLKNTNTNDPEEIKKSDQLLNEINDEINNSEDSSVLGILNVVIKTINSYEGADKTDRAIGGAVKINAPFSKKGILGKTSNEFVIFDTPGANSSSNTAHLDVLRDTLANFSNGIPILVTQLDNIDSKDTKKICDDIKSIDAINTQYSLIVVNKADNSELPEGGYTKEHENQIKSYESIRDFYSNGIFFVSSIMGLGAKAKGTLKEKHNRRIYKSQEFMFNDPEDEDYTCLYEYNIMPDINKENSTIVSKKESNLVYANSGILSVENSIETYGSKYSIYNKCQMVSKLLDSVIDETTQKLKIQKNELDKKREELQNELDEDKARLNNKIKEKADNLDTEFQNNFNDYLNECEEGKSQYEKTTDSIIDDYNEIKNEFREQEDYEEKQSELNEAGDRFIDNIKEHAEEVVSNDMFKGAVDLVGDIFNDGKEVVQDFIEAKRTDLTVHEKAADGLINKTSEDYKSFFNWYKDEEIRKSRNLWHDNTIKFKQEIIQVVTDADYLSNKEKNNIKREIEEYDVFDYQVEHENIFIKENFLNFNICDFIINQTIDVNRLAGHYNSKLWNDMKNTLKTINEHYYDEFRSWSIKLLESISDDLIKLNPELIGDVKDIEEKEKEIAIVADKEEKIKEASENINASMNWQVL